MNYAVVQWDTQIRVDGGGGTPVSAGGKAGDSLAVRALRRITHVLHVRRGATLYSTSVFRTVRVNIPRSPYVGGTVVGCERVASSSARGWAGRSLGGRVNEIKEPCTSIPSAGGDVLCDMVVATWHGRLLILELASRVLACDASSPRQGITAADYQTMYSSPIRNDRAQAAGVVTFAWTGERARVKVRARARARARARTRKVRSRSYRQLHWQ